jgi:hypothetical protein
LIRVTLRVPLRISRTNPNVEHVCCTITKS